VDVNVGVLKASAAIRVQIYRDEGIAVNCETFKNGTLINKNRD